MAPLRGIKKDDGNKRVLQVHDLATTLCRLLKERSAISNDTRSQLDQTLAQAFPSIKEIVTARKTSGYDEVGSALWNAATFMVREVDDREPDSKAHKRLAASLRTFAFLLLDSAHCALSRRKKDSEQQSRIFRVALKAVKFCLSQNALGLAQKVLERCSEYAEAVKEAAPIALVTDHDTGSREVQLNVLTVQYYILRVAHAWQSQRPDIADHFFASTKQSVVVTSAELTGMAAELYYDIGKSLIKTNSVEAAKVWLERAMSALNKRHPFSMDGDLEDLTLVVASSLLECLLNDCDAAGFQHAERVLQELHEIHDLGNRLVVLSMHLKLLLATQPFSRESTESLLLRIVSIAVLTEETFRAVMHCTHRVSQHDGTIACQAIERLVCSRILPDMETAMVDDQLKNWLEKAMTTYTMLSTSKACPDKATARDSLMNLFNSIHERAKDQVSPRATHALQTLIWKCSGTLYGDEAKAWFELLQHPLLDGAGLVNKARIGRKAMLMVMETGDLDTARAAFYRMPKSARDEAMSRYLAYKVALRMDDTALAAESLRLLLKQSTHDQKYLYACVLEAQQSGNRGMAIAALQTLVDTPPAGAHFPSLLRCVARLLMDELDNLERGLDEAAHEIIRIFETAANQTKALFRGPEDQWRNEIQWWSKNAFNLALRFCTELDLSHLIRLLRVCVKFFGLHPDDAGLMHHNDLVRRRQICHLLRCSALIVIGRSATGRDEQIQCYVEARKEVGCFMSIWQPPEGESDENTQCRARALEMLKFDVESVFRLERWDDLDQVLGACLKLEGTCQWETLADLIIIIHDHTVGLNIDSSAKEKIPQLLQKIINETWKRSKDVVKLAHWLRVTFSMDLDGADGDMSLKLVQQAAKMAERGTEGRHDRYPEDELQWMATSAFNRGVDLLAQDENEAAATWIENALELARWAEDNGSLHAQLTRNQEEANKRMAQRGLLSNSVA